MSALLISSACNELGYNPRIFIFKKNIDGGYQRGSTALRINTEDLLDCIAFPRLKKFPRSVSISVYSCAFVVEIVLDRAIDALQYLVHNGQLLVITRADLVPVKENIYRKPRDVGTPNVRQAKLISFLGLHQV